MLNQSELDVVTTVLAEARRANPSLAAAFEFEVEASLGARSYPVRRQIVQHNEGTGAFVRRLLRRRGISWCFRPGRASDSRAPEVPPTGAAAPVHTMVLFQNAKRLPQSSAGTIRFHRNSATEERDTITAFGARRNEKPKVQRPMPRLATWPAKRRCATRITHACACRRAAKNS